MEWSERELIFIPISIFSSSFLRSVFTMILIGRQKQDGLLQPILWLLRDLRLKEDLALNVSLVFKLRFWTMKERKLSSMRFWDMLLSSYPCLLVSCFLFGIMMLGLRMHILLNFLDIIKLETLAILIKMSIFILWQEPMMSSRSRVIDYPLLKWRSVFCLIKVFLKPS